MRWSASSRAGCTSARGARSSGRPPASTAPHPPRSRGASRGERRAPMSICCRSASTTSTHAVAARKFAGNVASLAATLRNRSPAATILFVGIPPLADVSRPALAARRTARRAGTPPAGGGTRNAVRRERALFRLSGIAAGRRVRTRRVPPGGGCLRRMGRVAARPVAQPASVGGLLDWCRISIATSVTIVIGSTNPSMIAENFGNRSWPRASSTRYAT